MKTTLKHGLFCGLAVIMTGLVGCGKTTTEKELVYPEYTEEREVFLSGYLSPNRMDRKYFEWAKEAGLTALYIDYYIESTETSTHIMDQSLTFCDEVGLDAIPMTCWGSGAFREFYDHPLYSTIQNHPSFIGFNILDEPKYEDFDKLADSYKKYQEAYNGEKIFFTNLLRPNNPKNEFSYAKDKTYDQYISGFVDKVIKPMEKTDKITMSETLYPMMNEKSGDGYYIMDSHLVDLARFAQETQAVGAEMYHFVQTVSFGNYHHATNEAEIRFQIYSGMAFGTKGWQYFTYWTPNSQGGEFQDRDYAMIDRTQNRTQEYYGVQAVNQELKKFEKVFLSFDWKNTMLIDGRLSQEENVGFTMFRSNARFDTVERTDKLKGVQADHDTLVGIMEDKNGNEGYTVVNYTVPTEEITDKVSMDLSGAKAVMVYIGGEEFKWKNGEGNFKKGILSLELEGGEGVFVIPVY